MFVPLLPPGNSLAIQSSSVHAESRSNRALERALAAARVAAENRGRDIRILDLRELTTEFDYFILVTGTSRRQLHAVSDEIDKLFEKVWHDKRLGSEGYDLSRWILLDYGDIVVHMFDEEARKYYSLEELWCNASVVPFEPPPVPESSNRHERKSH